LELVEAGRDPSFSAGGKIQILCGLRKSNGFATVDCEKVKEFPLLIQALFLLFLRV
jgi:hypothetical protein